MYLQLHQHLLKIIRELRQITYPLPLHHLLLHHLTHLQEAKQIISLHSLHTNKPEIKRFPTYHHPLHLLLQLTLLLRGWTTSKSHHSSIKALNIRNLNILISLFLEKSPMIHQLRKREQVKFQITFQYNKLKGELNSRPNSRSNSVYKPTNPHPINLNKTN